jgi:hypothetical protein
LDDSIGKEETPITEQEVIAAIRAAKRPTDSAVTDKLFLVGSDRDAERRWRHL